MHPRPLLLFVAVAVAVAACATPRDRGTAAGADAGPDSTPEWLHNRAVEEVQLSRPPAVPHDFWFEDRAAANGLTFVNRIVDDAGKAYKALHYDHGTGVCAADVEGDGDIDLYFVSQRGTDMLALNDGRGRFTDGTAAAGVATPDRIGVTCAFGDIDNHGRPDLFVTTVRHGNRLYRNLGGGRFADVTSAAGVGHVGHSSGAAFLDYDGDGRLDLFVTNVGRYTTNDTGPGGYFIGVEDAFQGHLHPDRAEPSLLYRNLGDGRFAEVSREVGVVEPGWNGDVTVLDVDEDGRPDLYLPNMQGENRLWRNVDGRRFQEETARWFPRTPWGAMGVKAFDFNGDGRRDLFVTDMHSDMIDVLDPADWGGSAGRPTART